MKIVQEVRDLIRRYREFRQKMFSTISQKIFLYLVKYNDIVRFVD